MPTIKIDTIDDDTDKLSDTAWPSWSAFSFATKNWPACKPSTYLTEIEVNA